MESVIKTGRHFLCKPRASRTTMDKPELVDSLFGSTPLIPFWTVWFKPRPFVRQCYGTGRGRHVFDLCGISNTWKIVNGARFPECGGGGL